MYQNNRIEGHPTYEDYRLARKAARLRWNVPEAVKEETVEKMAKVIKESTNEANLIQAAKTLAVFEGQNQKDEHLEIKAQMDAEAAKNQVTGGVTQINNYFAAGSTEQQRLTEFKQRMLGVVKEDSKLDGS